MSKARFQRQKQEYAANLHVEAALQAKPPNAVRRLLRRLPAESLEVAIARAQLTQWWHAVINPMPTTTTVWWIWYCDQSIEQGLSDEPGEPQDRDRRR